MLAEVIKFAVNTPSISELCVINDADQTVRTLAAAQKQMELHWKDIVGALEFVSCISIFLPLIEFN